MDTEHNLVIVQDWGQGGRMGRMGSRDWEREVTANGYGILFGVLKRS